MIPQPPASINYPQWKFYLDLLQMVGTVAVFIYVWWSNRVKVTAARFLALEKEVAKRAKHVDLEAVKGGLDGYVKRGDLQAVKEQRDGQCVEHKNQTRDLTKAYSELHIEVTRLPDRREITRLDGSIKDLSEKIGNLQGSLKGINRVADLMNEFLINQGGKK